MSQEIGSEEKHMLICDAVHQLYSESASHFSYRMYKWLLEFADRLVGRKDTIAAVVDLMQLPESDKIERLSFEYFLENREYLFFRNDELWAIVGSCHCRNYAYNLKPVRLLIVRELRCI